jgi:hypothetical protein
LGVLQKITPIGDELTFEELIPHFQKGALLCDLVSTLENNEILGVFRPPRTRSTAMSSIFLLDNCA